MSTRATDTAALEDLLITKQRLYEMLKAEFIREFGEENLVDKHTYGASASINFDELASPIRLKRRELYGLEAQISNAQADLEKAATIKKINKLMAKHNIEGHEISPYVYGDSDDWDY